MVLGAAEHHAKTSRQATGLLTRPDVARAARALTGVDLLSLDGLRAVRCLDAVAFPEVRRFLRVAKWVYQAGRNSYKL